MKTKATTPLLGGIDPVSMFADFEQLLVSNSGEDAFDVAVRLLAAKLEDEIQCQGKEAERSFAIYDSAKKTFEIVERLFRSATKRWPTIEFNGGLGITPEQLVRCMRPLYGWNLMGTDFGHLDAVLERLVARGSKGALGQYFTPRGVIRMCVEILNPVGPERVIDPACGSGGFLFEAVQHARRSGEAMPHCLGIDIGARALKVAALMATVAGSENVKISRGNSIDGREYSKTEPLEWKGFLSQKSEPSACELEKRRTPWGAWHRLQCEVLLTNPPFAGEVDEPDVISAYNSQATQGASRKSGVGREHLFLERAVNILAPGGRLAIVLPQGLLANASALYLRKWLMDRCRVLGVVGLHPYSFLPHTGVKTSVLFLTKDSTAARTDYPIFFSVSHSPGKDSRGRSIKGEDYSTIAQEFSEFLSASGFDWAFGGKNQTDFSMRSESVSADEIRQNGRLDAEYYEPKLRREYHHLEKRAGGKTIGTSVARNIKHFKRGSLRVDIDYIDISSVDPRTGSIVPNRISASDAPSRAMLLIEPGDILVSTVRPDRNAVALITNGTDHQMVASNGFCLLRPHNIPAELLYAYCRTDTFRRFLSRHATASMYPAVTDRDVLDMPLLLPPNEISANIASSVRSGLKKLEEAKSEIRLAVEKMNDYLASSLKISKTSEPEPIAAPSNGRKAGKPR